ncbi:CPBP family intramembrane glutamic endopeptidase [Streptobacillus ratti]
MKIIVNLFKILLLFFLFNYLNLFLFKVVKLFVNKDLITLDLFFIINLIGTTILISFFTYLSKNNKEYYKLNLKSILIIISIIIITLALEVSLSLFLNSTEQTIIFHKRMNYYKSVNKLLLILQIVVFSPIEEELFFRKIIFTYLENRKLALIVSIILFAFAHSFFNLEIFILFLPISIIISLIYYKTNSLKLNCIFHMLFNCFAIIKYLI